MTITKEKGTIPLELGRLRLIKELSFDGNNLTDTIPSIIGWLSNLEMIGFDSNYLNGTIPSEIVILLAQLKRLEVSHDLLSGSIPDEIFNWRQLQILYSNNNSFEGVIPAQISNLQNLELGKCLRQFCFSSYQIFNLLHNIVLPSLSYLYPIHHVTTNDCIIKKRRMLENTLLFKVKQSKDLPFLIVYYFPLNGLHLTQ